MTEPAPAAPSISVALCTYNGERHLREQIDSVLAQEDVAIELMAIDDGSSDASQAILADYARRDPRVRWQANERNLGPTASFERAMALCRGDFIAPCDQDDIWEPGKLARLLAAVGDADLAYCDSAYVDGEGRPLGRKVSDATAMMQGSTALGFLFGNSVSGHACLLRRDLFEQARPFPAGAYHDWWLALCAAGRRGVRYLDAPLVRFRRHEGAYSPMGKSGPGGASRGAAASRAWLEQRRVLMRAYAATRFRDSDIAAALAEAFGRALDGGASGPLMRLLWRHRAKLPAWKGWPALDALRMQLRLAKKFRRARRATG